MNNKQDLELVATELSKLSLIHVSNKLDYETLLAIISTKVSDLINYDLQQLIQLLYQLDISEQKLKEHLTKKENAANTIAALIIERQLEKIKIRKTFIKQENIPEDEKW